MSGIDAHDWSRKALQKQNQNLRGTNQSSGRSAVGPRGLTKGIQAGGLTGGGIGQDAINTDQMGNVQTSSHLNIQHSVLPLVSDATIVITANGSNNTVDIQIYGVGGIGTHISVNRPDQSIMLCPPVLTTTQSHNFTSPHSVYCLVYYDVFHDALGNGQFVVLWKTVPFTAIELATAYQDGKIPFLASPSSTITGLTSGTAGTYTQSLFGTFGASGGIGGVSGIISIATQSGPAITLGSSDSSVTITPSGNNIDLTSVATFASQTQNLIFASPNGSSGIPTFRPLVAADIPNLNFSKITTGIVPVAQGGMGVSLASTGGTSQVLKQTSVGGNITVAQLTFTDISGSVAATQLPNPSASTLGGIQSLAAASHKWINTISTSGVPSATQPAFTDLSDYTAGTSSPEFGAFSANGLFTSLSGGITFNDNPGGGTQGTLNDYEEGSWTPVDVSGDSLALSGASGTYVKIGKLVCVSGTWNYPSTAGSTHNALIGGLPFTNISGTGGQTSFNIGFCNIGSVVNIRQISSSTSFALLYATNGNAIPNTAMNTAVVYMSGVYKSSS